MKHWFLEFYQRLRFIFYTVQEAYRGAVNQYDYLRSLGVESDDINSIHVFLITKDVDAAILAIKQVVTPLDQIIADHAKPK